MSGKFSRLLMLTVSLAAFSVPAMTAPAFADNVAAQTHDQALQVPAGKFVQDLGDHVVQVITNKQLTTAQRDAQFNTMLSDAFDLKTIGRFVIGRTWNTATPQQQAEYTDLFKSLLVKNYGDRMTLASGETFQVTGVRPETDQDSTVLSQVTHPDGSKPTDIDWRVRNKDGKMGVIDVIVEGISLSVTQRQEYASIVQNNGGQIDGLLQMMRNQLNGPVAAK